MVADAYLAGCRLLPLLLPLQAWLCAARSPTAQLMCHACVTSGWTARPPSWSSCSRCSRGRSSLHKPTAAATATQRRQLALTPLTGQTKQQMQQQQQQAKLLALRRRRRVRTNSSHLPSVRRPCWQGMSHQCCLRSCSAGRCRWVALCLAACCLLATQACTTHPATLPLMPPPPPLLPLSLAALRPHCWRRVEAAAAAAAG